MIFSSPIFLFLFLPLTLMTVFLVRKEFRNLILLIASLVFYTWGEAEIVLIMFLSILGNFVFGLLIEKTANRQHAKLYVGIAIFLNLLLLSLFKYANFAVDNLNALLSLIHLPGITLTPIHLPIGISFFTFQAMSYIIDVYRRDTQAARNPINFALYIASFPQLIAGPIIRYRDVAIQLLSRTTNLEKFSSGVRRFIIGLGKKVLIASVLAKLADFIFLLPNGDLSTILAWAGIIAFTLQVYFDFSAYSDMAIGLGRMLGFEFKENFNYPFISQSIREFWQRWHISLSTWFRDYLYISMGGNRQGALRTYFNLFTVFFLCGLWHGASWNFIMLGIIHGVFMVLERIGLERWLKRLWRPLRHVYALVVVLVSFVFFRADSFSQALHFLGNMFGILPQTKTFPLGYFVTPEIFVMFVVSLLGALPIIPWLKQQIEHYTVPFHSWKSIIVWSQQSGTFLFLIIIFFLSAISMASGLYQPFIYFRF